MEKRSAIPMTNLDTLETIGNWCRLRKWIRSWSIDRKLVITKDKSPYINS
jgi:hypothetical protein